MVTADVSLKSTATVWKGCMVVRPLPSARKSFDADRGPQSIVLLQVPCRGRRGSATPGLAEFRRSRCPDRRAHSRRANYYARSGEFRADSSYVVATLPRPGAARVQPEDVHGRNAGPDHPRGARTRRRGLSPSLTGTKAVATRPLGASISGLSQLEADMHLHVRPENKILFPGAVWLAGRGRG